MSLAEKFASLFANPAARRLLAQLAGASHTTLPTFNLATTSLRHLPKWFDRLEEINNGVSGHHGNFYSDPAGIGLVSSVRPRVLTTAGQKYLAFKSRLHSDLDQAEYELLKILYFSGHVHSADVPAFLESKRKHMLSTIEQFVPLPTRDLFLSKPKLLVIAELVAGYPGAISGLVHLPTNDLLELASLTEGQFKNLCSAESFSKGLNRLCKRIASDFTRGEERRSHYIVSMCLLEIASKIPRISAVALQVPPPYSNLLTETDIYKLHAQYTQDLTVWFEDGEFRVSSSLAPPSAQVPPTIVTVKSTAFLAQSGLPGGVGTAAAIHSSRRQKKVTGQITATVIVDSVRSERSEDFAESRLLRSEYGSQLVRVGHTRGETIALPDGMVPGADFYVVNSSGEAVAFIEIKSISGKPPTQIALTRAEYLRACHCVSGGIPYRLLLVDAESGDFYEVNEFAPSIVAARLENVVQFIIKVG